VNGLKEHGVWHGEDEVLALVIVRKTRQCISNYVLFAGFVLNGVVIAKKLREVDLLFGCLNHLIHELAQAFMVGENDKWMP